MTEPPKLEEHMGRVSMGQNSRSMWRVPSAALAAATITVTSLTWSASVNLLPGSPLPRSDRSATVEILNVRARSYPREPMDLTALKGEVDVTVRLSRVDTRDIASVDLLLGPAAMPCGGTTAAASRADVLPDGSILVSCLWNTDMLLGECGGQQIEPVYPNGYYRLRAEVATSSGEVYESAAWNVTLKNESFLKVVHDSGTSIVHDGRVFYGGGSGGGNTNIFSICPVSYNNSTVRELLLDTELVEPGRERAPVHGPALKLRRSTTADMTAHSLAADRPFVWIVDPSLNEAVSNTDDDQYWLVVAGDITGNDGEVLTDEFLPDGARYVYGPLYFDFAPPDPTEAEIQVNGQSIAANTFYSEHEDNKFTLSGIVDRGVGVDPDRTRIAVGDCARNPRVVDGLPVDRSEVPFVAVYEKVRTVADLVEDDPYLSEEWNPDTNGVDCYVAELTELQDRLGNRWTEPIFLQTNNFGVDKQSPEIHGVVTPEPVYNSAPEIRFRIRDPLLASGDKGAPVVPDAARATIRDSIEVGRFFFDLEDSERAEVIVDGLVGDGEYTVELKVSDSAKPPNVAESSFDVVYDRSAPTITQLQGPNTLMYASGSIEIRVSGRVDDATSGIDEIQISVWNNVAEPGACNSNDSELPASRVRRKRMINIEKKLVQFDETMRIQPPAGAPPGAPEQLCVFVSAADVAGNAAPWRAVSRFAVDWGSMLMDVSRDFGTMTE